MGLGPSGGAETPAFNTIDLFSGVGGMTLGFSGFNAGPQWKFAPRLMADNDPEARQVALRNFPNVPFLLADLHKVSEQEIRNRAGLGRQDTIHVLMGGPPCQGFSYLGKRALEDERNALVLDYFRLVKELRPLVAVMENVPLMITSHGGAFIQEVCDALGLLGYSCSADIVVASDYGVPQLRKRAIVLAYRSDLGLAPQFPKRTHERVTAAALLHNGDGRVAFEPAKLPYVSVEEAIGDLPQLGAGAGDEVLFYSAAPSSKYQEWAREGSIAIFNHKSRTHSEKYLKKISVIEEGGRNAELPPDQRFSDTYFSQAYARLSRQGIAQTLTTCFSNPGSGRFLHYRDLRAITVREGARLQSFPDRFIFDGPLQTMTRHIGNAVPPLLAFALSKQIAQDLLAAGADAPRTVGRPKKIPRTETPEQRSRIMREVPSKNTSAEMQFRKALWEAGVRGFRLHSSKLPGRPDVVFPRQKVAVFVDGCFWHGCPKCYRAPKSHQEYWNMKVARNRKRDATVNELCKKAGWRVLRIWEHEVSKSPKRSMAKLMRVLQPPKKIKKRKAA
jgi:DNA (cytosine-5)-methyltransferase 1